MNIMPLISYVKTATNNQLLISESHGDSNRWTPCRGKPDTHNTYTSRASPCTSHICFLWAVHVRDNLSLAINNIGQTLLLLRKRAPDTIPSTPANPSTGPPHSFSPKITIEAVMKAKHLLTTSYICLLGL
jgi:hypothetical protein